ncbi:hypothetical protein BSLG_006032 [Batrachochytrium salamandrivorans]|nr:hypothetical protein BSLG_006032 [Batrachochytrium salamandrivorans]
MPLRDGSPKECMQHIDYSLNPIAHESDMSRYFYDPANDPNIAKTASIHDPQSFNNSNPFLISPATESKFHINKEDDEHSLSQTTEEICMSVHQDTENHYIDGTKPIQMEESEIEESKEYSLSQDICISSMPLSPSILSPPLIDEETQFTLGQRALHNISEEQGDHDQFPHEAVVSLQIQDPSPLVLDTCSLNTSEPAVASNNLSHTKTDSTAADSKVEDQYELDLFAFPEELPKKPLQSREAIKLQPDSESIVDIDNVGQFFDTEAPSTTSSKKVVLQENLYRSLKEPSGTLSVDDTITKDQVENHSSLLKGKHDQTKLSSILDPVSMNDSAEMRDCSNKSPEQQVRVLFTGIPENDERREIVDILGGTIVGTWSECTHLVTDRIRRTVKFLCAVSAGKHIMDVKWLEASKKEGEFAGNEAMINFFLEKRFSTSSVKPDTTNFVEILDAAGGSLVTDIDEVVSSTIAIADLQDISECERLREIGVDLYTTEVVPTGILRQELIYQVLKVLTENMKKIEKVECYCDVGSKPGLVANLNGINIYQSYLLYRGDNRTQHNQSAVPFDSIQ